MSTAETVIAAAVSERIVMLGRHLMGAGTPVSTPEIIDALDATAAVGLSSRTMLRSALAATMLKSNRHADRFAAAFDRFFPPALFEAGRPWESLSAAEAIASGDDLSAVAAGLVAQHGGFDGEIRSDRHHQQRVMRAAELARLMGEARKLNPDLSTEELRLRIEELKRLIASQVRGHLGPEAPADDHRQVEDIEFLRASRAELQDLRAAVRPMARKLAARLRRRRNRDSGGRVHMRQTFRKSIAAGGVPLDLAYERKRPHRPELFLLCDISGSVAEFSVFTLTLMAALSAEISRTRTFVFVDGFDEISDLLESTGHAIEPWQILRNTKVIADDGHSDYGRVFQAFLDEVGQRDLRPTSTVLITGDGRGNYRPPNEEALAQIARRARRVYWLNPEPVAQWDHHDSVMETYARSCTNVFEVRNLGQLMQAVEQIL